MKKAVSVNLDIELLFGLIGLAERKNMSVPDLIVQFTSTGYATWKATGRDGRHESIRALHAIGMTDGEIAQRLNLTRTQVAVRRRKLELNANKKNGVA
jgi:hypothetical protein